LKPQASRTEPKKGNKKYKEEKDKKDNGGKKEQKKNAAFRMRNDGRSVALNRSP
jgi:hypothetical protein